MSLSCGNRNVHSSANLRESANTIGICRVAGRANTSSRGASMSIGDDTNSSMIVVSQPNEGRVAVSGVVGECS